MDKSGQDTLPRLGIIISMFPELHETFILRELVALERRGVRFEIFSLQYPRDPITLDDAIRLSSERTTYSGLITADTLMALAKTAFTSPMRFFRCVFKAIANGYDRPMEMAKNLAILPLALRIGEWGKERGITHWHGHWANIPTTACWYLSQIHGQSWSAAIHGEDIFTANRFLQFKLNDALFSVACSGYFCNHLKTQLSLDCPEKIHLNYHGLDPRVTARQLDDRHQENSSSSVLTLVSIGRLVPTKGHDVLIKACGRLKQAGLDFNLQLIGSGPLKSELETLANAEGVIDQVIFRGALAFDDVLQTLEQADVFVLAPRLVARQPPDGIPNVIAEAMALGIPVVSTRINAIPELVLHNVTGCLVNVDDDSGIAHQITRIASDPDFSNKLRLAAREHVAHLFDQDANITDLLNLFEHYVSTRFIDDQPGRR
jgi:glycosyltransferase involved in cell wall biosynthesis